MATITQIENDIAKLSIKLARLTTIVDGLGGGGSGGGGATPTFETVSANLAAIDGVGEQLSSTTFRITYANGITKTIVDLGNTVVVSLAGPIPPGIDNIKTYTIDGDDFDFNYS